MFQRFDWSLAGYVFLAVWMGVLLFHVVVIVPTATRILAKEKLGEFALAVQERFHLWGLVLTSLATALLVLGGSPSGAVLSGVVFLSVLFSEYLRRRTRSLLRRFKENPSDEVKRELFDTYRFIAYATYTQAVAGIGALIIGWLRL